MAATKHDILDLVTTTVKFLTNKTGKVPDVKLGGDNILIGPNPISIADIDANRNNMMGFVRLVKGAM